MSFQIAIDGLIAAGKGTVARLVAERLGLVYVDTGAMYRATALLAKEHGVHWDDEESIAKLVSESEIILRKPIGQEIDGRLTTIILNGKDVSWEVRGPVGTKGSSVVAQWAKVRQELVKKQQALAATSNVIMEGRDITYRVLPHAQIKIYLTATIEVRARRRYLEELEKQKKAQEKTEFEKKEITYEQIYAGIKDRDKRDTERAVDPLRIVEGAWVLDTTHLTIEQVAGLIMDKARELGFT